MSHHVLFFLFVWIGLFHPALSQSNYTLDLDLNYPSAIWTGAATSNDLLILSAELGPFPDDLNLLVLDSNGVEKHFWHLHGSPAFQAYGPKSSLARGDYLYLLSQQYYSPTPVPIGYTLQKINFRTGQIAASRSVDYPNLERMGAFRMDIDNQGNLIIGALAGKPLPPINGTDFGLFLTKLDSNLNLIFEGFEWTQGYPSNGVHAIMATNDGGFLMMASEPSAPVYLVALPKITKFDAQMNVQWNLMINDNPSGFPATWGDPSAYYETDSSFQFHFPAGYDLLLSVSKSGYPAWARDSVILWEKNNFIWDGADLFYLGQLTYFSRKGDGTFNHNRSTDFPFGLTNSNWMAPMGENQIALLCKPQFISDNYLVVSNKALQTHCSLTETGTSTNPAPIPLPQYQRTLFGFNWTNMSSYVDNNIQMTIAPDTHNLAPYCGCRLPNATFQSSSNLLTASFTNTSTNNGPQTWSWDFGDGNSSTTENPSHSYAQDGIYLVCLTVSDSCGSDTQCDSIQVSSVGLLAPSAMSLRLYPNPSSGILKVDLPEGLLGPFDFEFSNAMGQRVYARTEDDSGEGIWEFDLGELPAGLYFVQMKAGGKSYTGRVVLRH